MTKARGKELGEVIVPIGTKVTIGSEIVALCQKADERNDSESLWCILAALRGCDSEHIELKDLTIGRIRAIVCPTLAYTLGTVTLAPLSETERGIRDSLLEKAPLHFRQHYAWAIEGIKKLYCYNLTTERKVVP